MLASGQAELHSESQTFRHYNWDLAQNHMSKLAAPKQLWVIFRRPGDRSIPRFFLYKPECTVSHHLPGPL